MAPIPNGWLECPKTAEEIINNKFFCFKTPLRCGFSQHIKNDSPESFTPHDVIRIAREKFNSKIGLWIDLTQTDKYYNKNEIISSGIKYHKLACAGGGNFVQWNTVHEFLNVCTSFLGNSTDGSLIGVHCTHGLNRTGFLVCAFLASRSRYDIGDAIAEFKKCRPIGIFRQSLIDQLCQKYSYSRRLQQYPLRILASPEPTWEQHKKHKRHYYQQPYMVQPQQQQYYQYQPQPSTSTHLFYPSATAPSSSSTNPFYPSAPSSCNSSSNNIHYPKFY